MILLLTLILSHGTKEISRVKRDCRRSYTMIDWEINVQEKIFLTQTRVFLQKIQILKQ